MPIAHWPTSIAATRTSIRPISTTPSRITPRSWSESRTAYTYNQRGSAYSAKHELREGARRLYRSDPTRPQLRSGAQLLAWLLATCCDGKYRNGKQAIASATRACELTSWKNAGYLDTLAAAYAEIGALDTAVKWQEKALALLTKDTEPFRAELQARLLVFRAGKPFHGEPVLAGTGPRPRTQLRAGVLTEASHMADLPDNPFAP